jgi:peptide/nickel transport system ATP-binding protein
MTAPTGPTDRTGTESPATQPPGADPTGAELPVPAATEAGPAQAARREAVLSVRDLNVRFGTDDGIVHAVRGITFDVAAREVLGIVGESGCGKSVSNLAIMGLLPSSARITGSVGYGGRDLLRCSEDHRRSLRGRKISMIFQDPLTAMNPVHTVGAQLAEAVRAHEAISQGKAMTRAVEMLDLVGIPRARERAHAYPHEFSGGMRQRAMIAMAIINRPEVIIADEPTTALDVTVQAQVLEVLLEVKDAVDAALILITHDLGVIAGTADRVLVMYAGRVVETGTVDEVFYHPRMPYTLGLLASIPSYGSARARLTPIVGAPPSLLNLPPGCPFYPRCRFSTPVCTEQEPALELTDREQHRSACHHWRAVAGVSLEASA